MPTSPHPGAMTWRRCGLAAASGVLLVLLFPPFSLSMLAWVALTPLILALDGASPRTGLWLGWLTGTIESLGVTGYWMFRAARDYFHWSAFGATAFTVAVNQVFVAVYFAAFGWAATFIAGRFRFVYIAALFVASEYARAHLLSGNPWDLLGHSQGNAVLIQLCDLTGVYGLSFLLVLAAAAAAELPRTRVPIMLTMLTVTAAMAYGNRRLAALGTADATHLDVVMVQANLPNDQRGQPQFFADHLSQYLSLTRQAAARPVGLIIWPENAIGFFPEENPRLVARITETLRTLHSTLLTGAPRAGGRPGVAAIYNSAYLFSSDGSIAVYDKRTLLPFVERAPLRADDGPYLPGTVATIFSAAGAPFGVLICYEAVYPDLARELIERGAAFLVNVSNDTWFEAGAGPEQHYEIARFRAVENRVSLVRVTNSGVSGVIDPAGREIARLPVRRAVGQAVGVPIRSGGSLYTRHGDVFAVVCIAVSAVPLLLRLFGRSGT